MKHVAIMLADGFEEIEALTPVDVLRRADIKVTTVSISNLTNVTGAHDINIKADALFNDIDFNSISCIVLPGGMPGAKNLQQHQKLNDELIRFSNEDKLIGAICAAPMIPGSLGLLKDKKATCFPGFEDQLIDAKHTNEKVVFDGNILTAKGAGVSMMFALKLVELLTSKEKAKEIAEKMFTS